MDLQENLRGIERQVAALDDDLEEEDDGGARQLMQVAWLSSKRRYR